MIRLRHLTPKYGAEQEPGNRWLNRGAYAQSWEEWVVSLIIDEGIRARPLMKTGFVP